MIKVNPTILNRLYYLCMLVVNDMLWTILQHVGVWLWISQDIHIYIYIFMCFRFISEKLEYISYIHVKYDVYIPIYDNSHILMWFS